MTIFSQKKNKSLLPSVTGLGCNCFLSSLPNLNHFSKNKQVLTFGLGPPPLNKIVVTRLAVILFPKIIPLICPHFYFNDN